LTSESDFEGEGFGGRFFPGPIAITKPINAKSPTAILTQVFTPVGADDGLSFVNVITTAVLIHRNRTAPQNLRSMEIAPKLMMI
jgi:hypothetical protein